MLDHVKLKTLKKKKELVVGYDEFIGGNRNN